MQPVVLFSATRYECRSLDAQGQRTSEFFSGPIKPDVPDKKLAYMLLPNTTNQWQVSIQNTESLRIANVHLFDVRKGALITPLQEPTLPKR